MLALPSVHVQRRARAHPALPYTTRPKYCLIEQYWRVERTCIFIPDFFYGSTVTVHRRYLKTSEQSDVITKDSARAVINTARRFTGRSITRLIFCWRHRRPIIGKTVHFLFISNNLFVLINSDGRDRSHSRRLLIYDTLI